MSNASSFSQYLLSNARPYIDAQVAKPFLQGMIHGNLPVDCFEFWLIELLLLLWLLVLSQLFSILINTSFVSFSADSFDE